MTNLHRIINKIIDTSKSFRLSLNLNKTKYIVISKKQTVEEQLFISGQQVDKIPISRYID